MKILRSTLAFLLLFSAMSAYAAGGQFCMINKGSFIDIYTNSIPMMRKVDERAASHMQEIFFHFNVASNPTLNKNGAISIVTIMQRTREGNMVQLPLGVTTDGIPIWAPYDKVGTVAYAEYLQNPNKIHMDKCASHTDKSGLYHQHRFIENKDEQCNVYVNSQGAKSLTKTTNHDLIGYAADGFKLYAYNQSYESDLDNCGGHFHDGFGITIIQLLIA